MYIVSSRNIRIGYVSNFPASPLQSKRKNFDRRVNRSTLQYQSMARGPFFVLTRPLRVVAGGAVVAALALIYFLYRRTAVETLAPAPDGTYGTYYTRFPTAENPISVNGNWVNGKVAGVDWADVRTIPGLAFGTESGTVKYDDSTALLTGAWGANQAARATVYSTHQTDLVYEEVELRLRSTLSPHRATGYEVNFRCVKSPKAYTQIVRWNGRLGDFTILKTADGPQFGVSDGDVVTATVEGNVITSYINGVEVLQTTDNTFRSGNPGIGFYLEGATGLNADFGFKSFAAADGPRSELDRLRSHSGPIGGFGRLLPRQSSDGSQAFVLLRRPQAAQNLHID